MARRLAMLAVVLWLGGCWSSFDRPYEDLYGPYGDDDAVDDDSGDDDDSVVDDDDDTGDDDTELDGPMISVSPNPLTIDPAYVGIATYGEFSISNAVDMPLIVTDMLLTDSGGGVITLAPWTGSIQPGAVQTLSTNLGASCLSQGQVAGQMDIESNDATVPTTSVLIAVNCI